MTKRVSAHNLISQVVSSMRARSSGRIAGAILEELKAKGFAVVELPKPDDIEDEFDIKNGVIRQYAPNGFGSYRIFTFEESPRLAVALLALAAAAERDSEER